MVRPSADRDREAGLIHIPVKYVTVTFQGLERQGDNDCRAPLFKKAPVRPQTARLTAVIREPGSLHGTGLHKISVAGDSTALAVAVRTSMCSADGL